MKYSLTLNFPINFVKIKNGERVIVEAGPVEPVLELLDGDIKGENPLLQVIRLLDQAEREMRAARRPAANSGGKSSNPVVVKRWGVNTTTKGGGKSGIEEKI